MRERTGFIRHTRYREEQTDGYTRYNELVLWLWRASEYCTKVRGTLHSRASLLVLSLMTSLLPVSPLPGSLLYTESRKVDGADDGEGQLAEVDIAPEEMLPEVELARNIWEHLRGSRW